jgi:hypothetical protein
MAQVRLHDWDKDDTILTLYFVKYDLKGLPVKSEKDLAEGVIGASKASLVMQAANVKYVLGYTEGTLDCFSDIQKKVVDEYNTKTFEELKEIVIDIIDKRDISGNIEKVRKVQKIREDVKKQKQKEADAKAAMDAMWRKLGKDPSKMKSVGTRTI